MKNNLKSLPGRNKAHCNIFDGMNCVIFVYFFKISIISSHSAISFGNLVVGRGRAGTGVLHGVFSRYKHYYKKNI